MTGIKTFVLSAALLLCGGLLSAARAQKDAGKTVKDVPMVKLSNGVLMPCFGLGTFLQCSDVTCRNSCLTALLLPFSYASFFFFREIFAYTSVSRKKSLHL